MTGFSSKTLLLFCLGTTAAFAQPEAPRATGPAFQESVNDEVQDAATPPSDTISEAPVGAPPIDGFGTLDADHGGLPQTVWLGSARETADPLLKLMHGGIADEALQERIVQLLMTQATPPRGAGLPSWFSLRAQALIAMGQDEKASQMIASLPASMQNPSLRRLETELQLARGDYDAACKQGQPTNSGNDDDFPRKLGILCLARAGKQEEAALGLDLMREERHADEVFFQEAIRRIGDKNLPVKANPKQWTALDVAALRLAGDSEKIRDRMDAFPPVTVKYLSRDPSLDVKLREKANARALQLALIPISPGNRPLEQPFSRPLASDVTTLVAALGSGKQANDADNAVIARLALDEGGLQDSRRSQRLLSLMEPFGYKIPPEIGQKLYARPERFDGEMPAAWLLGRLADAAQARKRGETLMLAGLITGGSYPGKLSDIVLLPVIRALLQVGFDKEARALAFDAVKDYGAR